MTYRITIQTYILSNLNYWFKGLSTMYNVEGDTVNFLHVQTFHKIYMSRITLCLSKMLPKISVLIFCHSGIKMIRIKLLAKTFHELVLNMLKWTKFKNLLKKYIFSVFCHLKRRIPKLCMMENYKDFVCFSYLILSKSGR